jgi:hypothetical protein
MIMLSCASRHKASQHAPCTLEILPGRWLGSGADRAAAAARGSSRSTAVVARKAAEGVRRPYAAIGASQ